MTSVQLASAPSMLRLPPEIVSTILRDLEGEYSTLRNCSLTCTTLRPLCLPLLFRELIISKYVRIRACLHFLENSPHLCQYVRRLRLKVHDRKCYLACDKILFSSILSNLYRLDDLYCYTRDSLPPKALSSALQHSTITKIHLVRFSHSTEELLLLLSAVSSTICSLTLDSLTMYTWFPTTSSSSSTISTGDDLSVGDGNSGPICMIALEQLVVRRCTGLPFRPDSLQMPNLKTLCCEYKELPQLRGCMPSPICLRTLILHEIPEALAGELSSSSPFPTYS